MLHELLFIDLFCGAGGTSTGVERARLNGEQCARVIACVNHDKNAIASHAANHPNALHFTEDIRTLDLTALTERTPERIYAGLIKFVAGGKDAFLSRYNSTRPKDSAVPLRSIWRVPYAWLSPQN